jgi:RNA polymerase sigma factor (sigma-70 family)
MGMRADHAADIEGLLAHAGWLRRFALALVRDVDEAEDLAQETMVSAWQHPTEQAGRGWLSRVARNLAVDHFRAEQRRALREETAASMRADRVTTSEELIGDAEIHKQVAEVVAGLSEPFRQTIVLRYYEGQSSATIARGLGVPEGTIRWRLKEGLDRVRRELDVRHANQRSAWVAALAPLLPRPWSNTAQPHRPPRASHGLSATAYFAIAAIGASMLSLAILGVALRPHRMRMSLRPGQDAPSATEATLPARGAVPIFNEASQVVAEKNTQLPPGPAQPDAQSLAEELLQAIHGNDYDAFVAKGSPFFRAALGTSRFTWLSEKLGRRLAQGRHVSTFGSLRREQHMDWLFKIEFTNGDDDALVTLAMDGWQVAGFHIDDPTTHPAEP